MCVLLSLARLHRPASDQSRRGRSLWLVAALLHGPFLVCDLGRQLRYAFLFLESLRGSEAARNRKIVDLALESHRIRLLDHRLTCLRTFHAVVPFESGPDRYQAAPVERCG